ncbi:MAG: nucleotidyl transferase AbiEii/AbiGii toxin family protein [Bacteroidota bacterium]
MGTAINSKKLESLLTVARGFGDWSNKVVFIGGKVLGLYLTDPAAPEHRPTEDVDCLISVPGIGMLLGWEDFLKNQGFTKADPLQSPATHWYYQGHRVHLLPPNPELLGFENHWFEEGLFHARSQPLVEGLTIRIFTPVYYLSTKLEAMFARGWHDLRQSEDFQDLIYLIEGRPEIEGEVDSAFYEVRDYIRLSFQSLLRHPQLREGLYYAFPLPQSRNRVEHLIGKLASLADRNLVATG